MTLLDLGALSEAQYGQLESGESDPFDGARIEPLTWRVKDRHVVLADDDGTLYASAALLPATVEVGGEALHVIGISGVIVRRERRGQGVAREIVELALQRAEATGTALALLFCHDDRAGLYAKLGFTPVGAPVTVDQPAGRRMHPMPAMWRPLRPGATWPPGPVALHGLPF